MNEELRAWLESDDEFVDRDFRLVLRRPPDEDARARALAKLAEGTLSRATLLHELATATESDRVRLLDDSVALHGLRACGASGRAGFRRRRRRTSA